MLESPKKTILHVEDDAIIALTSTRQLEQYGYSVIHVNTGEKAVEAVKTMHEIDLILMDINLGNGIDGTQAAEIILKDHDIPIVFVSSHTEREIVEKTEKITSYGYVVKATGITVLDASIKMAFKLFYAKINEKIVEDAFKQSNSKYKSLFNSMTEGFALHEIIFDINGKPIDYRFLDMNPAFESLTGLHRSDIINQTVLTVLPNTELSWIEKYGNVALTGEPIQFESYSSELKRHFQVVSFSPEINKFATIFMDITNQKKLEIAIKDAAWRLEGIIEGTQAGTWEWNVQTGETTFNSKWAEIIGYTLEELAPVSIKTWEALCHPDDLKQSEELLNKHFSGDLPSYFFESRMRHKDGHWVWVLDKGKVLTWTNDGKPLLMFGTHSDITERKRLETILIESKEKYSAAFNTSPYAITITRPKDGMFVEVNDAFNTMLGFSHEETESNSSIGMNLWVNEEDRNYVTKELADGKQVVGKEFAFRKKNGEIMLGLFSAHLINISNDYFILSSIADVTEQKKVEEALGESESNSSLILEKNPCPMMIIDTDNGCFVKVNEALTRNVEYSREELIGKNAVELGILAPETELQTRRFLMQSGQFSDLEIMIKTKSGKLRIGMATGQIVEINGHDFLIQTMIDITEISKTKETLKKSEELHRTILQTAMDGYWLTDTHGNILNVNESYCKISGYCRQELLTMQISDIVVTESDFEIVTRIQRVIKNGSERFNSNHRRKDGSIMVVEVSVQYQALEGDRIVSFFRDITERKMMEEALDDNVKMYQQLFEAESDAIFLIDDETGNIVMANIAAENKYGYSHDEIISQKNIDMSAEPDVSLNSILKQDDYVPIMWHRKKNGEKFPVEICANRFMLKNRSVTIAAVRDISERKRAEERLRESDERLKRLAENAHVMIYRMDLSSGKYEYVSPASSEIFGYSQEDFYNGTVSISTVIHKDFIEFFNQEWQNLLIGKMPPSYEYKINHKDGCEKWLFQSNVLVMDEKGTPLSIEGIVSDITGKKLAEEKNKSLLAEKELILKEVHHRIKNNLNSVISLISLQVHSLSDEAAITVLKGAENRIHSMSLLYDKLYQSVDFMSVSIKDYLPNLIDEIVENFPNNQIVKVEKKIQDFILDAKRIQPIGIIINELLTNIMKYAFVGKTEGMIIVSATSIHGHVSIIIQDDGNGILESVSFENSTGFGLQLVHALTQQLDGTIKIERGDGTKVVLEFEM